MVTGGLTLNSVAGGSLVAGDDSEATGSGCGAEVNSDSSPPARPVGVALSEDLSGWRALTKAERAR